jgi:6-pyruvoyltetrahydropterin/6-carboxytetrahydropterin synthase
MLYVTRKAEFSAAHRLFNPKFSDEQNEAIFDKCNNPSGHGHNYTVEVTVVGEPNLDTGYVMDLKKLSHLLDEEVIEKVDHKHLNHDVDFLKEVIPTAENLAVAFWRILCPKITEGRLYSVRVYESEKNYVEYRGE